MEKSVLLVDDEANILKALARVLNQAGFLVKTAESGAQALDYLQSWPCKVLLTDFRMPYMDGAELLATVKAQYPDIVGLVISGYSDFAAVKTLLNAGTAFRYLQKPWDNDELLREVNDAFEHYQVVRFQNQISKMLLAAQEPLLELSEECKIIQANAAAIKLLGGDLLAEGTFISDFVLTPDKDKINPSLLKVGRSVFLTLENRTEIELSCRLVGPHSGIIELAAVTTQSLVNNVFELPELLNFPQLLQLVERYVNDNKPLALAAVKVRSFDVWSLTLGYPEAEYTLESVVEHLLAATSPIGELAFLANEQFVIVLPEPADEIAVLQKIGSILSTTMYEHTPTQQPLDFAVSYCLVPEDGSEPRNILNNLLMGNMLVSESNLRMFIRFDGKAIERKKQQLSLSQALHFAIEKNQLFLNFQPKLDIQQRKLSGCEVLVRWQHPEYGLVSPALFIPIAEQHGQIIEIGYWVLQQACNALANWKSKGLDTGKMAINVSGRQLIEPGFIDRVRHCIKQSDIEAEQLEFELTETFLLENFEECVIRLTELSNLGVSIAIDDFGTGYSSLAYLNKLPSDVLKIDRTFVLDIESNLHSQTLISNVVRLAHDLGLKVVVEGVEHIEQLNIVQGMGCDFIQGYCISKPLSEREYLNLMTSTHVSWEQLLSGDKYV